MNIWSLPKIQKFVRPDGRESGYVPERSVGLGVFLGSIFFSNLFWGDLFKTIFGPEGRIGFAFAFAVAMTALYIFVVSPLLRKFEANSKHAIAKHAIESDVAAKSKKAVENSISRNRGKPRSYK